MLGDIITAFTNCLRAAPCVKNAKASVVYLEDDGGGLVNTNIPAVVISMQNSDDATVFIGGLIKDKVELQLSVITELTNYSGTPDNGIQQQLNNFPIEVRRWIEANKRGTYFTDLMSNYNFFAMYKGFKKYQTRAVAKQVEKMVMVVELRYSITMVDYGSNDALHPTSPLDEVILEDVTDNVTNRKTILR